MKKTFALMVMKDGYKQKKNNWTKKFLNLAIFSKKDDENTEQCFIEKKTR